MRTRVAISVLCVLLATTSASAQTVWYVDDDGDPANGCTSWEDACPELQTALSLAGFGDQIWVAEGTYRPDYDVKTGQHTRDRFATFQLISGVAIYGGFDGTEKSFEARAGLFGQTTLTGDLLGNDEPDFENNEENSYHVVTGSSTDASAVHDGFTITRGNANTESGPNRFGGGMYSNGGSPTVMNCIFSGNRAQFGGGMLNDNSSPMVNNCTFSGNRAQFGGGMYSNGGAPVITHCAFIANSAVGKFADGGGMLNFQGSNSAVAYCTFRGNTADERGGGMYNYNSSPTVDHCTFNGNTAFWGGGMFNSQRSNSMVTNCTIAGNSAAATGGIGTGNSTPTVRNCVVWGNNPEQWPQIGGGAMVTYSDVQGGWSGAGSNNIDADPLFVDADGPDDDPDTWEDNDYRLAAGSPCIDAADNTAVPKGVVTDLDGNPRFVDDPDTDDTGFGKPPIVDMGAYEFQFQDPCADDDGDGRVTICHIPPGNLSNARTITISVRALPAHLAHGDFCGPCEDGDG